MKRRCRETGACLDREKLGFVDECVKTNLLFRL